MHGGSVDEKYCITNTDIAISSPSNRTKNKMHQKDIEEYFKEVERVIELDDGYSFQFLAKSKSIEKLTEFITLERKRCPSVEFELVFEQNLGPISLQIKGTDAKEFIKKYAPSWLFEPPYLF